VSESLRVLGVVPARGGSKGLPGKNTRLLAGVPLIGHSLRAADRIPEIDRTVVSTDSDAIAAVARELGADVPFRRPAALAADDTPMAPVLRHALAEVERIDGRRYDLLVLLDPTSPARDPGLVSAAIAQVAADPELDGVISVSAPHFHPLWVGVRPDPEHPGALTRYFPEGTGVTRRQQLDRYLRINGSFYVWRTGFVRRMEVSWFDEGRHGFVETPEWQAFAIDDLEEFRTLEALVAQGRIRLP
jgi:N-acylneuraminate cytidylyltransferase